MHAFAACSHGPHLHPIATVRRWNASERTHVVVHFHPDRFGFRGTTVAEALLKEGVYRNQFETGLSSGSMSAFPGGERDRWENTLFGGVYHAQAVTGSERPKYGALELVRYADGPIPRLGHATLCCSRKSQRVPPSRSWAARIRERQSA